MSYIFFVEKSDEEMFIPHRNDLMEQAEALCQSGDGINPNFIQQSCMRADMLFILYHENGSIGGFASVIEKENSLYIDLVCNKSVSRPMTLTSVSATNLSGKDIIDKVIEKAKEKNKRFVDLSSVQDKISYYRHLNFGFREDTKSRRADRFISDLREAQLKKDKKRTRKLMRKIVQYNPGYYNDMEIPISDKVDKIVKYGIPMYHTVPPSTNSSRSQPRPLSITIRRPSASRIPPMKRAKYMKKYKRNKAFKATRKNPKN